MRSLVEGNCKNTRWTITIGLWNVLATEIKNHYSYNLSIKFKGMISTEPFTYLF